MHVGESRLTRHRLGVRTDPEAQAPPGGYVVVQADTVASQPGEVWQCLTSPERVAAWFADVDVIEPGRPFSLAFGDGDSFAGQALVLQPPSLLELQWKFMGVGPRFSVRLHLSPLPRGATRVTVVDRGALTWTDAQRLRKGWRDSLSRLARHVESGERTRRSWGHTIEASALLPAGRTAVPGELREPDWWFAHFPSAVGLSRPAGEAQTVRFAEPAWGGIETEATIHPRRLPAGLLLTVRHHGWSGLPERERLPTRRRYAEAWQNVLEQLEAAYLYC